WCTRIEPVDTAATLQIAPTRPTRFGIEALSTEDEWHGAVRAALDEIGSGHLAKVVLARAIEVTADAPFDVRAVLGQLVRAQPGCTVYADGGFVGASPELLIRKRGTSICARPLAGTGRDAERLAASTKDAREHAFVVEAVKETLRPTCRD